MLPESNIPPFIMFIATIPVMSDFSSLAPDPMSEEFNMTGIKHNGSSFIVIASSASTGMSIYFCLVTIVAIYIVGIGFNLMSYHVPICIDLSVMLLLVLCGIIGAVIIWHKFKRKQSPKLVGFKAEKSFNPSRYTIIDTVYLS